MFSIMHRLILLLRFGLLAYTVLAHAVCVMGQSDSITNFQTETITNKLEQLAQLSERQLDYSDLMADYLYYVDHPINLNGKDLHKLLEMQLLTDLQLHNLNNYISQTGIIYSVYELKDIPGFNIQSVEQLLPFIVATEVPISNKINLKNVFKFGKHQLLMRYGQTLEVSKGYTYHPDSSFLGPSTAYLGPPQKYYARYAFNYRNQIRFGFTTEKDAGELLPFSGVNDTINKILSSKAVAKVDFLSAFAYIDDLKWLKKFVLGDYHLEFGQGLTLWSGLSFGKSLENISNNRFGKGIRANTATNENRFFRGSAVTLGHKGFELTAFISKNSLDGNIILMDGLETNQLSSIQESGLHRTINEILDRDAFEIATYGGHILYRYRFMEVGITAFNTKLSKPLEAGDALYQIGAFSGSTLQNYGADFKFNLNKIHLFSEVSLSSNGGLAYLLGMDTYLNERLSFSCLYHDYGRNYQNLFHNPFAASSNIANEKGLYTAIKILIHKKLQLSAYLDRHTFPWLTYRAMAPSSATDISLQINYNPSNQSYFYGRFRHKLKQQNHRDIQNYCISLVDVKRNELLFFASYSLGPFITLKNRIDYVRINMPNTPLDQGYMMYQDVLFRHHSFAVEATFRYALFDTDTYNSRIYAYEHDVLYAFSVPAYYGRGQRIYLMLKLKAINWIDIWVRLARTTYFDRNSIGSGSDEIKGNHKTEIKLQLKLKL